MIDFLAMVNGFNEVMNALLDVGFLTGSRAFGTSREDSDWDVCYPVNYSEEVNTIIKDYIQTPSDYFAGYTVNVGGNVINLIPVHPHEFLPWYLATCAMKSTLITSGLAKKPIEKYSVFMGIVSLFKGTVDQQGTLQEYNKTIQYVITQSKLGVIK